eukprot:CAMPEP_0179430446 /NCGR_PEP_ID=MMETSP0799-20121207/15588_1 /TAXON_ID=46947 /ORGANISM="Geminigera cryophila, Strain CCMP2564" /LENGTH=360 /DNA_ID=CAMNT_0021206889 /DNA_START=48 /DNA_END=1131 /DNA_ORIENTATION=+
MTVDEWVHPLPLAVDTTVFVTQPQDSARTSSCGEGEGGRALSGREAGREGEREQEMASPCSSATYRESMGRNGHSSLPAVNSPPIIVGSTTMPMPISQPTAHVSIASSSLVYPVSGHTPDRAATNQPTAVTNQQHHATHEPTDVPPPHQPSGRGSPFCVSMLLNRYTYGEARSNSLGEQKEAQQDTKKDQWCPCPPPPLAQGWRGGDIEMTEMAAGAELNEDMKETRESSEEEERECVVCMDKICVGQEVSSLTCKHVYHYGCIQLWFVHELNTKAMATCPLCQVMVFDARHLQPIEAEHQDVAVPRERTQIEILLRIGETYTPFQKRCGRFLTLILISCFLCIVASGLWVIGSTITNSM